MNDELDRILDAAQDWLARDLDFALATVVGVRGSTYRGLAARQLVGADGQSVGAVSGGCLDEDLQREAAEVIRLDRPRVVEFDLTADDEAVWGWGIGCNGATRLVVEPPSSVARLVEQVRRTHAPSSWSTTSRATAWASAQWCVPGRKARTPRSPNRRSTRAGTG